MQKCCLARGSSILKMRERANMLNVGSSFSKSVVAEDQTIRDIARLSGDINPIHLDDEYAKQTVFGRRIAHALFCQNIISMIIGNHLPGSGAILLSQNFRYQKPVYIDDTIETTVTVKDILDGDKYVLTTVCTNQKNEIVLDGESVIKWTV